QPTALPPRSDAKSGTACCRPPNSGDHRPAHPPSRPRRSPDGWSEVVTPSSWAAPVRAGPSFDRRALTQLLQLEQLAQLELPFGLGLTTGLKRKPLGPFDGLVH